MSSAIDFGHLTGPTMSVCKRDLLCPLCCPLMSWDWLGERRRRWRRVKKNGWARNKWGGRPVITLATLMSLLVSLTGHRQLWPWHGEINARRESSRFGHVEVVIQRWPPLFSHFCFFTSYPPPQSILFFPFSHIFFSLFLPSYHFPWFNVWCLHPHAIVIKTCLYACLQPALFIVMN